MFTRREIRIKAMQYLYAHYLHTRAGNLPLLPTDSSSLSKRFAKEEKQVKGGLLSILELLSAWVEITRKEEKEQKYEPHLLVNNSILKALQQDATYQRIAKKYGKLWENTTLVLLYYDQLKAIDALSAMTMKERKMLYPDFTFLKRLLKKVLFQKDGIANEFNELDIGWEENSPLIKEMSFSFLKKYAHDPTSAVQVLRDSAPPEEQNFYVELITKVLKEHDNYTRWTKESIKNWDVERLVLLDRLLICMGMAEALHFPETPKSVIINEYLEIAKAYSTHKSSIFIHGVLDHLIKTKT